jgi:transcriptional regulator with XRE-family HTH domain
MENSTVQENFNTQIAATLRGLLRCSPKTQGKTTYKVLAKHLGVKQQSVSSWANGTTIPDTKHIVPLAEYFGVSCDYLLGRTRAAAPDDFIQEAVARYGLSEQALSYLERLNAPLNIDVAEQERVINKQLAYENAMGITEENIATKGKIPIVGQDGFTITEEFKRYLDALRKAKPVTKNEFQTLTAIMDDETCKQALTALNVILTTSTGREDVPEWETYGLMILKSIYDCCYRAYPPVKMPTRVRGILGALTIDADKQRTLELQWLNEAVLLLRGKLIRTVHMKPLQAHVTEKGREFFDKIKREDNEDA